MNQFDNVQVDAGSWAFDNLFGKDKWTTWTPVFGGLTLVGTPVYTGRLRRVGRHCELQVKIVPGTSIAATAGTGYLTLPIAAKGVAGMAVMTNDTTNIAVGLCHVDVATGRCYLPTQGASGNTFTIAGWFEA